MAVLAALLVASTVFILKSVPVGTIKVHGPFCLGNWEFILKELQIHWQVLKNAHLKVMGSDLGPLALPSVKVFCHASPSVGLKGDWKRNQTWENKLECWSVEWPLLDRTAELFVSLCTHRHWNRASGPGKQKCPFSLVELSGIPVLSGTTLSNNHRSVSEDSGRAVACCPHYSVCLCFVCVCIFVWMYVCVHVWVYVHLLVWKLSLGCLSWFSSFPNLIFCAGQIWQLAGIYHFHIFR